MNLAKFLGAFVLGIAFALSFGVVAEEPENTTALVVSGSGVTGSDVATQKWAKSGKAGVTILAQGKNAFLGKLWLAAGAKVPLHRDATEEYIYLLEGAGMITIDGVEYPAKAGDSIYMAANAEVAFQNGEQDLVAVQVFAGPAPAKKYDTWVEQRR